jgi:hypothetical protein
MEKADSFIENGRKFKGEAVNNLKTNNLKK